MFPQPYSLFSFSCPCSDCNYSSTVDWPSHMIIFMKLCWFRHHMLSYKIAIWLHAGGMGRGGGGGGRVTLVVTVFRRTSSYAPRLCKCIYYVSHDVPHVLLWCALYRSLLMTGDTPQILVLCATTRLGVRSATPAPKRERFSLTPREWLLRFKTIFWLVLLKVWNNYGWL